MKWVCKLRLENDPYDYGSTDIEQIYIAIIGQEET